MAELLICMEQWRHDSGMLGDSGLLNILQQHAIGPQNNILCLYGDSAYAVRPQLIGRANVTQIQREWNKKMSAGVGVVGVNFFLKFKKVYLFQLIHYS